jgi:hypothetical protein
MSFADTFGHATETPYQQLSAAPPVQMGTVKRELRANLRVITEMTTGALLPVVLVVLLVVLLLLLLLLLRCSCSCCSCCRWPDSGEVRADAAAAPSPAGLVLPLWLLLLLRALLLLLLSGLLLLPVCC